MCLHIQSTKIQDSYVQRPWMRFKQGIRRKRAHNPGEFRSDSKYHLRYLEPVKLQRNDSMHSTAVKMKLVMFRMGWEDNQTRGR